MNNCTFHLKLTSIYSDWDLQGEIDVLPHEKIRVFIIVQMLHENVIQNNIGKISQRDLIFCCYLTIHNIIFIFIILIILVRIFWRLHPYTIYLIDVPQAFWNDRQCLTIIDQVAAFDILTRISFKFIIRLGSLKSWFINSGADDISIRYHITIIDPFELTDMRLIPIWICNKRWLIWVIHHFAQSGLFGIEILILASWYCVIVPTDISISIGTFPWLIKVTSVLIVLHIAFHTIAVVILIIDDDECFLFFLLAVLIFIVKCVIIWIKGIPKPLRVFLLHSLRCLCIFLIIWVVVQQGCWWLSLCWREYIRVGVTLGDLYSLIEFLHNVQHLKHGILSNSILVPVVVGIRVIVIVKEIIGSIVVIE